MTRARSRSAGGSLSAMIAMKIRLSILDDLEGMTRGQESDPDCRVEQLLHHMLRV